MRHMQSPLDIKYEKDLSNRLEMCFYSIAVTRFDGV